MYDLAVKQKSSDTLVEALCLLQYLLSNSPNNFHAKLLCLQLYHLLGCGWAAHETYESLDIKHVQLDSMGYLHCAQLPICGNVSITKPLYNATLKFFTASYKESLEYLAMCYKFGSFSKLQEFMDFRDRLSNSLHYSMVSAEALLLELTTLNGTYSHNIALINGLNIDPGTEPIRWDELSDNRDLSVVVRWDPKYPAVDDQGICLEPATPCVPQASLIERESFVQNVELLRVRSALLRAVSACVETVIAGGNADEEGARILQDVHANWRTVLQRVRSMELKPIDDDFLVNLLPSRLMAILAMPYEQVFDRLLCLVLALEVGGGNDGVDAVAATLREHISDVGKLLAKTVREHNEGGNLLWTRRSVQEIIVNCIEVCCGQCILASFINPFLFFRYCRFVR